MNEQTAVVTPERSGGRSDEDEESVSRATTDSVAAEQDSRPEGEREPVGSATDGDDAAASESEAGESAKTAEKTVADEDVSVEDEPAAGADSADSDDSIGNAATGDAAAEGDSDAAKTDAISADADADADADAGKSRFRWRSLVPRPATGVLLLLLVVAVVLAAVFGWKLKARNDDDAAGQAAMAAAKDYAVALTSIDSAHIDADFSTVLNGATGQFKDMYSQSATQLKPLLLQAKSVSKGHVVAASVQSASSDHAVVMLFVDAEITNVTNPQPRVDRNRILMTMDRVGGHWLASKVDLP